MNAVGLAVRLLAGVALILTNGFFVAIEFALTRARQFTEEAFVGRLGSRPRLPDHQRSVSHPRRADPQYLGVERSRFACRYGVAPLYWSNRLISPIITLGDWIAKWTLGRFGIEMTGAWLGTEEDVIEDPIDVGTDPGIEG